MTLSEQDSLAAQIAQEFPGSRIVDRRAQPSHGYRAVHVIATVDGFGLEIQVRTRVQDSWAQSMEKVADAVGRGIRYGEAAPERARELVATLFEMSEAFAVFETATTKARAIREELHDVEARLESLKQEFATQTKGNAATLNTKLQDLEFATLEVTRKSEAQNAILGMAIDQIEVLLKRIGAGDASGVSS